MSGIEDKLDAIQADLTECKRLVNRMPSTGTYIAVMAWAILILVAGFIAYGMLR